MLWGWGQEYVFPPLKFSSVWRKLLAFSTPSFIHSSKRMRSDLILWLSSEGGYFPNGTVLAWVPQPTHGLCGIFSGEAQRHLDTQLTTTMFRPNLLHRWNYLVFLLAQGLCKKYTEPPGACEPGQFDNSVLTPHLPFFFGATLQAENSNSALLFPQRGDGGVLHHLSLGGLSNS